MASILGLGLGEFGPEHVGPDGLQEHEASTRDASPAPLRYGRGADLTQPSDGHGPAKGVDDPRVGVLRFTSHG